MTELTLTVPIELRRGALSDDQAKSLASAASLFELMCRKFELEDMADVELLDMGCGTKLVQAILEYDIPIKRYVGVDVYQEMIEFLRSEVTDERFAFHHMDTHNEMYNSQGIALDAAKGLPFEDQQFDLICLYSVFTHLAPHDYSAMLKLLRPYIKHTGSVIFSLYVNEETDGGHGLIDALARGLKASPEKLPEGAKKETPPFVDAHASKPLAWALYSREHAIELCEGTGWEIESLNDPEESIQHYMICKPI
jgi:SAM-dependent methyltransferase